MLTPLQLFFWAIKDFFKVYHVVIFKAVQQKFLT